MAAAAGAFVAALNETQRSRACFAFGEERRDWSFLPALDRDGLPIGALDDGQRRLAHELIAASTSLPGYDAQPWCSSLMVPAWAINLIAAPRHQPAPRWCNSLAGPGGGRHAPFGKKGL